MLQRTLPRRCHLCAAHDDTCSSDDDDDGDQGPGSEPRRSPPAAKNKLFNIDFEAVARTMRTRKAAAGDDYGAAAGAGRRSASPDARGAPTVLDERNPLSAVLMESQRQRRAAAAAAAAAGDAAAAGNGNFGGGGGGLGSPASRADRAAALLHDVLRSSQQAVASSKEAQLMVRRFFLLHSDHSFSLRHLLSYRLRGSTNSTRSAVCDELALLLAPCHGPPPQLWLFR